MSKIFGVKDETCKSKYCIMGGKRKASEMSYAKSRICKFKDYNYY